MKIPHVFVGTMSSGEGDLEKCCSMVNSQTGVEIEHKIISGLPERDAHSVLFKEWKSRRDSGQFDAFIKVDADTVLAHNEVVISFYKMIIENPRITGIQAPLLDYFTDGFINGLNFFSTKVDFKEPGDKLFCDRVDINHDVVIKADGVPDSLRPAGFHCYDATEIQAFHFGVHRQLKSQQKVISLVKSAWLRNKDKLRGFAILGAECAKSFESGEFNYTDEKLVTVFESVKKNYDRLINEVSA